MSPKDEMIRVTAELDVTDIRILKRIATSRGITLRDAMRSAISNTALLQQRQDEGWRILLQPQPGYTELAFKENF